MGCCVSNAAFWPPDNPEQQAALEKNSSQFLHKTKTSLGNTIVIFYYPIVGSQYTVLYSHGNAENIATSKYQFMSLAITIGCNVCAYDYSGYGGSTGNHSEKATYDDIRSVYNWLQNEQNKNKNSIILFGRSLGSGPTIDLASEERGLKGLILQSPLRSAIRTQLPDWATDMFKGIDIFSNENKISTIIDYPIYIIHGTNDNVVPFSHGQWLYEQFKKINQCGVECHWVQGCGHNDITTKQHEFDTKLKQFLNNYIFNSNNDDNNNEKKKNDNDNKDENNENRSEKEKEKEKEKEEKSNKNETIDSQKQKDNSEKNSTKYNIVEEDEPV